MSTILSDELLSELMAVGQVDVLVGLPTLNHSDSVGPVVRAAHVAFNRELAHERTVLVNVDGGSVDGTPDIVRDASIIERETLLASNSLRTRHRISGPYHGVPGKAAALRTVFAAADLLQALESAAAAGDRLRARVLVRNARVQLSPETVAFLRNCLTQVGLRDSQAWECLNFALDVLADEAPPVDFFRALADRKRWLVKALTRGRKQGELLGQANIETLMSQGARLTVIDEDDTRRRIGCIDRICAAVFGRLPQPGPLRAADAAVELTAEEVIDAWRHSG